jgi:hypothetical protein
MIQYDLMDSFLISAKEDPRIGPNHISLFAGLVKTYKDQGGKSRVYVFRKDLASICKLNGTTTFHKTIRELHEYGYITYTPSYNHFIGNMVTINNI